MQYRKHFGGRNKVQPILDSNEQLINRMQEILQQDRIKNINILNDKLTLSVFSQLQQQMKKVSNINLILKDPIYSGGKELSIEFKSLVINKYLSLFIFLLSLIKSYGKRQH